MKTKLKSVDKHVCSNKSNRRTSHIHQLCSRISFKRIKSLRRMKTKNQASKMRDTNKLVDLMKPQSVLSTCVSSSQN